jgi:hypothetical protein
MQIATDLFAGVRAYWTTSAPLPTSDPSRPPYTLLALPRGETAANVGLGQLRFWLGALLPSRIFADFLIGLVLVFSCFFLTCCILGDCRALGCAVIRLGFMVIALVVVLFWTHTIWVLSDAEFHGTYTTLGEWAYTVIAMIGAARQ